MIFATDDVFPSNLKYFKYWDLVKEAHPELKLICFVVAKYNNDENEDVSKNQEFKEWYERTKKWVTIGVHGYDHQMPQEGWRDDQEKYITMARNLLMPYLPTNYLYRPPGFRFLGKTESILKKLGFAGIAHETVIKYFSTGELFGPILNTHCCDKFNNPIEKIWKNLVK